MCVFNNIIAQFDPISLSQMDEVKLMNRTDSKFFFNHEKLHQILEQARSSYRVLEVCNERILDYRTQYFDTEDFKMYKAHQNSKLNRYKIRQRVYLSSNLSFLEIKFKSNKGITLKKRIKTEQFSQPLNENEQRFIEAQTPYEYRYLRKALINNFSRITLVHNQAKERVTIDLNLNFQNSETSYDLPFLAIAEVKREGLSASDFIKILKENRIYSQSISKYSIGALLLNKHLKHNRFKNKLISLIKIANNDQYYSMLRRN
ncbi:MAG: polyphosphate polymerase domain-containing protein [Bacteroidales bacterium]|nr:polyphosphate polymerase domain-containing protein [Bacteroidales bacterium]